MKTIFTLCLIAFALMNCNNSTNAVSENNDTSLSNIDQEKLISTDIVDENKTPKASTSEFFITNDGIAGIKLGMKPDEIASKLPDLEYKKEHSDIEPSTIHTIKKDEKFICIFDLGEEDKITSISVGEEYKTKEGIGTFSTVKEVSKIYNIAQYKIVDGAEGIPFICLTIKEMPNLQLWLDIDVPEGNDTYIKKLLANVPETSKITDILIENHE